MHLPPRARNTIQSLGESKIREVANSGFGLKEKPLAFWFGEPASVTPAFIREAAKQALDAGDTFYHHNLGTPELRHTLAQYIGQLHKPVSASRVVVTGSGGVNALMLAAQAILEPGDEVVAVVPLWPNITEIPAILGASVRRVALQLVDGKWRLGLQMLLASITAKTKAVIINSPNNPTGWVMSANDIRGLLHHCRTTGTWIISDEAYERLVFSRFANTPRGTQTCAPSFLDVADDNDKLLVANTFSKTWQMTGWRLGWLVVPSSLEQSFSKIVEFNSSCAPGFIQSAACVAIKNGNDTIEEFATQLNIHQELICDALSQRSDIVVGKPDGAMYVFFKMDGVTDSLSLAKALVREAQLGLAPGIAFGTEGEGFLRWCIAKPPEQLSDGLSRFQAFCDRGLARFR